jgi:hypothetical protein
MIASACSRVDAPSASAASARPSRWSAGQGGARRDRKDGSERRRERACQRVGERADDRTDAGADEREERGAARDVRRVELDDAADRHARQERNGRNSSPNARHRSRLPRRRSPSR